MGICSKISRDLLADCASSPTVGIEQWIVLINRSDIAANGLVFDPLLPNSLITAINLRPGTTGYLFGSENSSKQVISVGVSVEVPDTDNNGFRHTISGIRISDPSELGVDELNKIVFGVDVIAIIETKYKGTENKYAYQVFGINQGLTITADSARNSNENSGVFILNLATPANATEPYAPAIYRNTDYSTSQTTFNNKFAGPTTP